MKELPLLPPNPLSTDSSSASTIEELIDWRVRDRLRTVAAGLILCLHLGVDPPDVCKPSPCARWECWIDPSTGSAIRKVGCDVVDDSDETHMTLHLKSSTTTNTNTSNNTEKVREAIARNLLLQYENWQPRVRYKSLLDPTVDELRKLCTSLRKSAKHERVLLHYNGHGVPRPTRNGEFWVFNKQFTQYIPVNVADVVAWLGCPAVWILDCPAAGFLSNSLQKAAACSHLNMTNVSIDTEFTINTQISESQPSGAADSPSTLPLIVFSACDSHETLPFTPSLPADILTSCLTTPLDMAIRWHCHLGGPLLPQSLTVDAALQIPGKLSDRRTPLGELNWIFTAVTDTIAWLVLPRDLFRRLYRQDLLIASLSRNYLLAQRILKSLYCTASAYPPLPPTHQHNLWNLWDHALDTLLAQLQSQSQTQSQSQIHQSTFFPDQLAAFELWLQQHRNLPATQIIGPPDQLPAALQVLLSQNLRPRALKLFAEFCDFGPWACLECLHVGIHPYILKLITSGNTNPSTTGESITKSLLQIWTRLMSVDASCKADLLKDSAFMYFVSVFPSEPEMAAMALTVFSLENPQGRAALLAQDSFKALLIDFENLNNSTSVFWRLLLSSLFPEVPTFKTSSSAFFSSDSPEIRTAALLALNLKDPQAHENLQKALLDPSPLVRLELGHVIADHPEFADILEAIKRDPFSPVATRNYSETRSNFIAHCLNDAFNCTKNKQSRPFSLEIEVAKHQALNQLEMDAWLERPIPARKFDSQLAVLECDSKIDQILFHPQKSQLFLLDTEGILRRWNWESEADLQIDQLPCVSGLSSCVILLTRNGEHLISCTPQGNVTIHNSAFATNDRAIVAFSCRDTNVKLLELKSGEILLAGDSKVSFYNPSSQKLKSTNRKNAGIVTGLLEIDSGFILSTSSGSVEFHTDDEKVHDFNTEIAHLWTFSAVDSFNSVTFEGMLHAHEAHSHNSQFGQTPQVTNLGSGITCFDHHPLLPLLCAYGTADHSIKICELTAANDPIHLQSIKYHDGFLGQRLGPINAVSWHPSRLILAAVTSDTFISIFGNKRHE